MINKLFITALKYSGTIASILFMSGATFVNATEYVFSSPSEVDDKMLEIPAQEEDYPFYECDFENSEKEEPETATSDENYQIYSHNCDCIDCGTESQEIEGLEKLSSDDKFKS